MWILIWLVKPTYHFSTLGPQRVDRVAIRGRQCRGPVGSRIGSRLRFSLPIPTVCVGNDVSHQQPELELVQQRHWPVGASYQELFTELTSL